MIQLHAKVDLRELENMFDKLRPENVNKVMKSSMRKLHKDAMIKAQAEVANVYDLRRSNINRYIGKPKARTNGNGFTVSVEIKKPFASLLNFATGASVSSSITRKKKHSKVVVVKIIRGSGAHIFSHAFLMNGRKGNKGEMGNIGLFERVRGAKSSSGKDKIKRLSSVGPISMFRKTGFDMFKKHIDDNARTLIEKKIRFYFKKENRGAV